MSSDNGIYILHTKGPEYRVAYHQNINAIYGKFNDETFHWNGDNDIILEYFAEAQVFSNLEEALDKAEEISYNYDFLEDGICVISDFRELDFKSLKK